MNSENQLLSAKSYLEQSELQEQKFKVLYYLENDFVRALGFMTPLAKCIGIANVSEIVIDSTFKTNQERFELFVVNANCGEYGMPLAYLYLLTLDGTEEAYQDPRNKINTRVQALCEFFSTLRQTGLLPVFVLLDKDAGEIAAVSEAWSWTANLQLCYWHLEHAINRRIKDKSKSTTYTAAKASDAYKQFDFVDPKWIPQGNSGTLCPEDSVKQLLELVKRHANMHPLIPISKDTFWTSTEIYHASVKEIYQFCHSCGLVRLWYNKKDWKLFARSAFPTAMPIARTTMITESHWRVLKHNYKYNYNRPRLDRLTQILAKQLVPDFKVKLVHYNLNRGFPTWWQAFKKDWNKAATASIQPEIPCG